MINHARTLLLNQARNQTHYSDLGYEYIPGDYKPIELPSTFAAIRQILFGTNPDNYFRNFRCREFLSYIHATELAEYMYRFDPRVTYWPEIGKPYFEPASKRVFITQTYGAPKRLSAAGDLFAITATGKAFNQYTVTLRNVEIDGQEKQRFEVRYLGRRLSALNVVVEDPQNPPIVKLPETNLSVRLNVAAQTMYPRIITKTNEVVTVETYSPTANNPFNVADEELSTPVVGDGAIIGQWLIESKANPISFITTGFPSLETMGEPAFLELFGLKDVEPYLTFKNLWFDHPLPAYKLSGIVLALIYRTEELRG